MREKWADIKGWEGKYQISNLGRVKRLSQILIFKNGNHRKYPERICRKSINMHGYEMVQLWDGGKSTHKQIHRLMAEAFLPNPKKLEQVNHINGRKSDNRLENLEWISRVGNSLHATYELKRKTSKPCKKVFCTTTGIEYPSVREASRCTGICSMCISHVANGSRKSAKGTEWVFV